MSANPEVRDLAGYGGVNVAHAAFGLVMPGLYGILILDLLGTISFCNSTFESMTGGHSDDLLGRSVCDVLPDLPFSRKSPDYNRAMVTTKFGQDRWWPHRLALASRGHCFVDVCIVPMVTDGRKRFVLEARRTPSF